MQQYGVTVIVGSPAGLQKMEVDVFSLLQGRRITGTSMGGWRVRQIPELAEKCLGKVG
jgi:Zn-dependent alcohol dehydrogenase